MEPLVEISAVAVPLEGANIDTDRIIPARLLRLPRDAERTYANSLFHDLRFRDDGSVIDDFILNQQPWAAARILVAGPNFGCGSSRESAVFALHDYGFRVIVAESFGDIFYANCVRNGIAPLKLNESEAGKLRASLAGANNPTVRVSIRDLTVTGPDGTVYEVALPGFMRDRLLDGTDEVAMTLQREKKIDEFERRYFSERPWLDRSARRSSQETRG